MKTESISARIRVKNGKGAARQMRRAGQIPAVVYGGANVPANIQLDEREFVRFLRIHTGEQVLVDLTIDAGAARKVLLKEIQRHPVTGTVIHVDFNAIALDKKIRITVPLKDVGEPEGVLKQGGILEHMARSVRIECLPMDIPEHIEVNIAELKIGDHVLAGQLVYDKAKYRLLEDPKLALIAVVAPAAEEAAAAEAEAGAVEPEVITAKQPKEGEEAVAGSEKGDKKGAAATDKKGAATDKKGEKGAAPAADKKAEKAPAAKK